MRRQWEAAVLIAAAARSPEGSVLGASAAAMMGPRPVLVLSECRLRPAWPLRDPRAEGRGRFWSGSPVVSSPSRRHVVLRPARADPGGLGSPCSPGFR